MLLVKYTDISHSAIMLNITQKCIAEDTDIFLSLGMRSLNLIHKQS